jgi:hypothetical protein
LPQFHRRFITFREKSERITAFLIYRFFLLNFFCNFYIDIEEMLERGLFKSSLISEIFPTSDEFSKYPTPIALMHIGNNGIPHETKHINGSLPKEWSTEMSNMERFSNIRPHVINYDCFMSLCPYW